MRRSTSNGPAADVVVPDRPGFVGTDVVGETGAGEAAGVDVPATADADSDADAEVVTAGDAGNDDPDDRTTHGEGGEAAALRQDRDHVISGFGTVRAGGGAMYRPGVTSR